MNKSTHHNLRGRYEVTKRRVEENKLEGGGRSHTIAWDRDGFVDCEFELEIDEERLLRLMGHRAAFSKRGYSVLGGGAVKLKVVKKTRIPKT